MQIDDELDTLNFRQIDSCFNKSNNLSYMYYKISDYKSILERIFKDDYDKVSEYVFKTYSEWDINNDIE